jgi:hypothetical protein
VEAGERLDQIRRLVIAESDMRQVEAAADYLAFASMNADAARVLETGLVVTYARPFGERQGIGTLDRDEWAPKDEAMRKLHFALLKLRNKLYAHSDRTEFRDAVDVWALTGIGGGKYAESHAPMSPDALPRIARLARDQRHAIRDARELLEGEAVSGE